MDSAAPTYVGSYQIRDQTCISCIAGLFFTTEPPEKPWTCLLNITFPHLLNFFKSPHRDPMHFLQQNRVERNEGGKW